MIISQIVIEPEYYLLYKTYEPELTTFSKTLCMLYLLLFIFYLVVMIINVIDTPLPTESKLRSSRLGRGTAGPV